jgi:hypothetical protein
MPSNLTSVEPVRKSVTVPATPSAPSRSSPRTSRSGGRWERRPDSASARESYDSGWEPVIGRFAETAA